MGDSFESVNLEDYVVNVKDCLIEYNIIEEKKKRGGIIYRGFIKNSSQGVKIFKRAFQYNDLNSKIRFDNLMKAFNQGVVLADNIFIGQESNKEYYSYIVEPWFKNSSGNKAQNQSKFKRLSDIIRSGELDTQRRQRLFQNLVISLKCLHQIGEPHYEISPKNIWIEDNYLVYLRPFKLDKESCLEKIKESGNMSLYYAAPEVYFQTYYKSSPKTDSSSKSANRQVDSPEQVQLDIQNDLWGLGCIFAEIFLCQAPLFSSSSFEQQAFSYFLVLGIPEKEEAYYMKEDHHNQLCDRLIEKAKYEDLPILKHIMNKVPQKQSEILTSLLEFHPQNRVNCVNLLKYSFFQQHLNSSAAVSPTKSNIINGSAEKMSLFDFSVSQRTNQKLQQQQQQQPNYQQNSNQIQGQNQRQQQQQGQNYQYNTANEQNNIFQDQYNNKPVDANKYYTQQPVSQLNQGERMSQQNSESKNNNWWNNDFSEQKNIYQSNPHPYINNEGKQNISRPLKSSDKKDNILYMDTYNPHDQSQQRNQQFPHHQTSQQSMQNKQFPPFGSDKKYSNQEYNNDHQYPPFNTISRQSDLNQNQSQFLSQNDQTSPPPKSIQGDSVKKVQVYNQKNPISSIQSQRSPDFSVKNDNQRSISTNSRNNMNQQQQQNNYLQQQDPIPSQTAHTNSNGNFSCNLTPIPHKVYQPSSNRVNMANHQRERINLFEDGEYAEGNSKLNIKTNNIFDAQKPKFFLSQPQSQKGIGSIIPQLQQQNPHQRSFQGGYNRNILNQSDEQNNSYISQNQTNKSAYLEYNDRINRLFGKNEYKQATASSMKGRGTVLDQYEQQEEEYTCVLDIKIKSFANLIPDLSNSGMFICKVDIPYVDQQFLSLEGNLQYDPAYVQNQKKIIPVSLELSQAFNYKNIKQVLSEQPVQLRLLNQNQEVYAHAFMDLSFNFLLKNPTVSDELLWQKPVQQWYHLINPEDPNQSYGKIKIETMVVILKQNQKNTSFAQHKRKSSNNSFAQGYSTQKNQNTQVNRSLNYGQKRTNQNQSYTSLNKVGKNIKKNSSLNNLDHHSQIEKTGAFSVLRQIQESKNLLDLILNEAF